MTKESRMLEGSRELASIQEAPGSIPSSKIKITKEMVTILQEV